MTNVTAMGDCVCRNTTLLSDLSICTQNSCPFEDQIRTSALMHLTTTTFSHGNIVASDAENSLCAAYPKESRAWEVQITTIVTLVLCVPIVVARCVARLNFTKRLWIDDWTALVGMVLLAGLAAIDYISSQMGFGLHYWNVGATDGVVLLQLFYVAQLLYIMIQVTSKVSIACLFIREFPTRWIRLTLKIFIAFMVCHGIVSIMVIIFQCWPIYSVWDKTASGKCVDITMVGFVGAGISLAEDILLVLLPIVELRKLQITSRQRIALSLIFAIACFAMVAGMIRLDFLIVSANTFDSSWDNVDVVIWSSTELLTIVFLGSLPPLRPWINQIVPRISVSWTKPPHDKSNSSGPSTAQTADKEIESKHNRAGSVAVSDPEPPRYSNHTKSSSFAVSAISSIRSSFNPWWHIQNAPLHVPRSKFQDSAVALTDSVTKRWSQQPDSPTDPHILHKCMSIYLTEENPRDLESNISRSTWSTRDTWTLGAVDRLSSKFTERESGQQL